MSDLPPTSRKYDSWRPRTETLADELNKLKERWGKETTAIKAMYEVELEEARKVINDAEKEKARLEIRCSSLEEQIEELRSQ